MSGFHSSTSSARASSVGGTSRASAFAFLRLITNSYLVGACTGKVGRLLAFEDAINAVSGALVIVDVISSRRSGRRC